MRGSRVISPSQHRPLNSTPLVETKSDTRKAKLLQMHKPSCVHPLSALCRPHGLFSPRLLIPPLGSLQPPNALPSFPVAVSSSLSFDSCSFQLPTYTQSTLFIAKTSFCNSPSPPTIRLGLPFSLCSSSLSGPLRVLLLFSSMRGSRTLHFLVGVLFLLPPPALEEASRSSLLFYHSIPDRALPVARSSTRRAAARLPTI